MRTRKKLKGRKNVWKIFSLSIMAFFTILFFPSLSPGSEIFFDFSKPGVFSSWQVERGANLHVLSEGIHLQGTNSAGIVSPDGLSIDSGKFLRLFASNKENLVCVILFFSDNSRVYNKKFNIKFADNLTATDVYIGDILKKGPIRKFAIFFRSAHSVDVTLGQIKIRSPKLAESLVIYWKKFWSPNFLSYSTINHASMPVAYGITFPAILYITIIVTTLLCTFYAFVKKKREKKAFILRSVLVTIVLCAILYNVRMDYDWLAIWKEDLSAYRGSSIAARSKHLLQVVYGVNDNFFDLLKLVKRKIKPDNSIHFLKYDDSVIKYYLLPLQVSARAADNYIMPTKKLSVLPPSALNNVQLIGEVHSLSAVDGFTIFKRRKGSTQ